MDSERLVELLEQVRQQQVSVTQAVLRLRHLPYEDLGFAKIDHHRALRQGFPEVIMGQGKQAKEIAAIVRAMRRRNANILVTRVDAMQMAQLKRLRTGLKFHSSARAATWSGRANKDRRERHGSGCVRWDIRYPGGGRSDSHRADDG